MAKNLTFISVEHFIWFGYLRIDNSLKLIVQIYKLSQEQEL